MLFPLIYTLEAVASTRQPSTGAAAEATGQVASSDEHRADCACPVSWTYVFYCSSVTDAQAIKRLNPFLQISKSIIICFDN